MLVGNVRSADVVSDALAVSDVAAPNVTVEAVASVGRAVSLTLVDRVRRAEVVSDALAVSLVEAIKTEAEAVVSEARAVSLVEARNVAMDDTASEV